MKLINKIRDTILKYNMIEYGDKILVAVSGGPDSICLLHVLLKLRDEFKIGLYVCHVNHLIRGNDADKDAEYVKSFCKSMGIECFVLREKVEDYAKAKKLSSEMAGREIRYDFFNKLREENDIDKVAIAHNANDNAETMLMRIIRGTGIEGLHGIMPVRDKVFIRPLIEITRREIEDYCMAYSLKARIDKTNFETIYARNKIRLKVIPYIEENFNSDIINTLNRFSNTVNTDNDYLNMQSEEYLKRYCTIYKGKAVLDAELFHSHEAMVSRTIRKSLFSLRLSTYNFEKKHISDIIELQKKSTGKQINLTNNIVAINEYGSIVLTFKNNKKNNLKWEYKIAKEGNIYIEDLNINIETSIMNHKHPIDYKDKDTKFFDYDRIKGDIIVRNRRDGDNFIPLGMQGRKKLKDFFINEKIHKEKRDSIPLLCFNNEIAWVVGYRISDKFAITKNTNKILKIQIKDGSFNEG